MSTIVLATDNLHKLHEITDFLSVERYTWHTQNQYQVTPAVEDQLTFAANALKKARNAQQQTGQTSLADDSGLCVPALHNAPGIYSARYAGLTASAEQNSQQLLTAMQGLTGAQRQAFFVCCLAYVTDPESAPHFFYGYWHGEIILSERGDKSFGYNNIFYVQDLSATAAELSIAVRNKISHRAIALTKFKNFLCR